MLFCDSPRLVNLSLEFQLRGNGVSFSSTIGYRSFSRPLPSSPNALVAVPLTAAEPLPPPTVEPPPPQSEFTTVVLLLLLFGLAAIFCTTDAATTQCLVLTVRLRHTDGCREFGEKYYRRVVGRVTWGEETRIKNSKENRKKKVNVLKSRQNDVTSESPNRLAGVKPIKLRSVKRHDGDNY